MYGTPSGTLLQIHFPRGSWITYSIQESTFLQRRSHRQEGRPGTGLSKRLVMPGTPLPTSSHRRFLRKQQMLGTLLPRPLLAFLIQDRKIILVICLAMPLKASIGAASSISASSGEVELRLKEENQRVILGLRHHTSILSLVYKCGTENIRELTSRQHRDQA